jgi:filamentous hemagglutinin family protein
LRWSLVVVQIALLLVPAPAVLANPLDGSVVAGSAAISQSGNTLTVTQLSNRAIINWQEFSIQPHEVTQFVQPSSSAAVLNRVTGGNPSAILGTLQSNGQVYLVNPNGVFIGPGANINVGSLVASTLNVGNDQFMLGGDLDFEGTSRAGVVNYGNVRALEGDIYLIGARVENHGQLLAPKGTVGLAAGQSVRLADSAHPHLTVRATSEAIGGTGVLNTGLIEGLQAELVANGGNVYALAVNNEGVVRANGTEVRGGRIFLVANGGKIQSSGDLIAKKGANGGEVFINAGGGEGTSVTVSGRIDVSGVEQGGSVTIRAGDINLVGSTIDASGQTVGTLTLLLGEHTIQVSVPTDPPSSTSGDNFVVGGTFGGAPSGSYNNLSEEMPGGGENDFLEARKSMGPSADDFIVTIMSSTDNLVDGGGGKINADDGEIDTVMIFPDTADSAMPFEAFTDIEFVVNDGNGQTVQVTIDGVRADGTAFSFTVTDELGTNNKFRFKDDGSGDVMTKVTVTGLTANITEIDSIKIDGETVIPAPSTIIVRKVTDPTGSTQLFAFSLTDPGSTVSMFDLMDGDEQTFAGIVPGTYSVAELGEISPGLLPFDLTSIVVTEMGGANTNPSSSPTSGNMATLNLDAGETIIVVFTNTQRGQIIIEKTTLGGDGTFNFTGSGGSDLPTSFDVTTTAGFGSSSFVVAPNTMYGVTENVPSGWKLSSSSSTSGTPGSFTVASGETVTVSFENKKLGTIVVEKTALGGNDTFNFTGTGGSNLPGSFDITTTAGFGSTTFMDIDPDGAYGITENVPSGWSLANSSSTSGAPDNFMVAPGETVTVSFENIRSDLGKIIVKKEIVTGPSTTPPDFKFTADFLFQNESNMTFLNDGEMDMSFLLEPGMYNVTETQIPGYALTGITGATSMMGSTATVDLGSGQIVTLVFTNTEQGRIIVEKQTDPRGSSDVFGFTADFFQQPFSLTDGQQAMSGFLTPGRFYSVQELGLPAGWQFEGFQILGDNGNSTTNSAARQAGIFLDPGENVRIVFRNSRQPVVSAAFFRWDPIFPDGIGGGFPYYGSSDRDTDNEIAGASSASTFGP